MMVDKQKELHAKFLLHMSYMLAFKVDHNAHYKHDLTNQS